MTLPVGIYDQLIDRQLGDLLASHPELRSILTKLDPEEAPSRYASFLSKVLQTALRCQSSPDEQLALCNAVLEKIGSALPELQPLAIPSREKILLTEITPPRRPEPGLPRPVTPLVTSTLFTGARSDPRLANELSAEMFSADRVDILVSFIKWSGLRLLKPALENLSERGIPVRVITTSYMGASDATAVEELARMPNVQVRVSYDTQSTRLHAKAYHFHRETGFSTAYIGSSNMSHAAMSDGLEWNLKITAQDLPHIVDKFQAEFESYWASPIFEPYDEHQSARLREALQRGKNFEQRTNFLATITALPHQERILEALDADRVVRKHFRNLVVAATGTGKTVIAGLDYQRFTLNRAPRARLLFLAHRETILKQALGCFQTILRDPNFGELLVGNFNPSSYDYLFCSISSMQSRRLWEQVGADFYDYIVLDEAHHAPAESYRAVFEHFRPSILLGLTATPERMDGNSILPDFGGRFTAEIRLPEALEEKLLCPFQYFAVSDPVAIDTDRFWSAGKFVISELEKVYTGAHAQARARLEAVCSALTRYEPDLSRVRGLGFCVSVKHAEFMASCFSERGIPSAAITAETPSETRSELLAAFRRGELTFLFTVDLFNEGLDVPDINTVLFLRPTDSLTVFLQQLGRGLRHSPEKDCLTVLDFVGQAHRRYRIDRKFAALLPSHRGPVLKEVEADFPHLPPGCSIQLERYARRYIIENIQAAYRNLKVLVPELLRSSATETPEQLRFGRFIQAHDLDPTDILKSRTWSQWKADAGLIQAPPPSPVDKLLHAALLRAAQATAPGMLQRLVSLKKTLHSGSWNQWSPEEQYFLHYFCWAKSAKKYGFRNLAHSFEAVRNHPTFLDDLEEIADWRLSCTPVSGGPLGLPYDCLLELHGSYSSFDINTALGGANWETPGQTGVGVLPFHSRRTFALLITFEKTEGGFSPTTMYADYPVSPSVMHWQSQSNTSQHSKTGQALIHHAEREYNILLFARVRKKQDGITVPFTCLGKANLLPDSVKGDRPISMLWQLEHPMPADLFEEGRQGG